MNIRAPLSGSTHAGDYFQAGYAPAASSVMPVQEVLHPAAAMQQIIKQELTYRTPPVRAGHLYGLRVLDSRLPADGG